MFCHFHNHKPARSYWRFSNFSQYQLTPWWRHDLDMFSAVVAFREGTFHEINNADWISNADLWCFFIVRLNKLLNKESWVELLVIWDAMPLTYRQCNDRGPGIIVDTLNLEDRAPVAFVWGVRDIQTKWIVLHFMTNPTVLFYTGTHGFIQYSPGPRLSTCDDNC